MALFVTPIHAAAAEAPEPPTGSLFFTPSEAATIDKQLQKAQPEDDNSTIHLGAVIYYGPDDWSVWLQGKKWTPDSDTPNLHIVDVKANEVRLSLSGNGGNESRIITLHPHQTYRLSPGN